MRGLYWRPRQVSTTLLVLTAIFSIAALIAVEQFKVKRKQPYYREKLAAAKLAEQAFAAIKTERVSRSFVIDVESDPSQSALIGLLMTPVTSNPGSISAKQTSINPNFAAVAVELLKKAGVREGDRVAVSYSGSFPALNIAVSAALQTLKTKPVITSSVSASQWGANDPNFLWVDMEKHLYDQKILTSRSLAASVGGIEDRGLGLTKRGRRLLTEGIARNAIPLLEADDFATSIEKHMALYRGEAGDFPITAFVNVGGGTTSVGSKFGKRVFKPGLNSKPPKGSTAVDSLMSRFVLEGVPVIHFLKIEQLADTYGLPLQPKQIPHAGQGKVFVREEYNVWLAAGLLAVILLGLYAFIRTEWGPHLLQSYPRKSPHRPVEPSI